MIITNESLLAIIDATLKDAGVIEVSTLGESILQPQKFDRFIRTAQSATIILPEARYIRMEAQQVDIDRIAFIGRVFDSLEDASGNERELAKEEFAKPQFHTNKLICKGMQAIVGIKDTTLRKNIEKGNLENTILDLLGEAGGRDLEEFALLADTDMSYAQDHILSKTDGWIKQAVGKVYGGDGGFQDFNPEATTGTLFPENMFEAALYAIPKVYLKTLADWRFYITWEVEQAYRKILKSRGTPLGDTAVTQAIPLAFEGIPLVRVPLLERAKPIGGGVTQGGPGRVCLLSHPDNMAWGVFFEVTLEREREAKLHRTDFVATCEVDAGYEDENAAVAMYIDKDHPIS